MDTNLLLLLVVGRAAPQWIGQHSRLKKYSVNDFNILVEAISKGRSLLVIPHCIAEASNLLPQGILEPLRSGLYQALKMFVDNCDEEYIPSSHAATQDAYLRLGITDAAWLSALNEQTILLTDDNDLYLAASNFGHEVINFSHYRQQ
jgi:hypothetical protein